jgi:DNA-directed RNA polymerase specialized sigma subunit
MPKRTTHYLNNKDFLKALINYREIVAEARSKSKIDPPIPDYIGKCLDLIANRLSNKPNFIGYPFKEDMIQDGVENCLKYILVFDPDRSSNPFAYFTQAIKNAFIRKIKAEKKQLYLKFKSSQSFQLTSQLNDNRFIVEDSDTVNQYIEEYEQSLLKKKAVVPMTSGERRRIFKK